MRVWLSERVAAVRVLAGHGSDVNVCSFCQLFSPSPSLLLLTIGKRKKKQCIKFHPNSLYIATGSSDRTCRLWDIQKGTCVRVFVGHRGSVTCIAMSPDGKWLASGCTLFPLFPLSLLSILIHFTPSSGGSINNPLVSLHLSPPQNLPRTYILNLLPLFLCRIFDISFWIC